MPSSQVAAQVKQALEAKRGGDAQAGVGIVAMDSFDNVSAWLKVLFQTR